MPVRARFLRHQNGYTVGALDIATPGAPGVVTVKAIGANKAQALQRAGALAERIASDPIMQALMPPQAVAAIRAAKGMSTAARHGSRALRGFLKRLRGPGAERLAKSLHQEAASAEGLGDVEIAGLWSGIKKIARYTPAGLAYRGAKRIVRGKKKKARRAPTPREQLPAADEEMPDDMPDETVDESFEDEDGDE